MVEAGRDLSNRLRDLDGEYKCDIIIALTHARVPNVRYRLQASAFDVSHKARTLRLPKHCPLCHLRIEQIFGKSME